MSRPTAEEYADAARVRNNERSLVRDCPICPSKAGERCIDRRSARKGHYIVNYYAHKERYATYQ